MYYNLLLDYFRWSKIASHFPGRTDNEIKNHWNTRIKKKLKLLGVDANTHKNVDEEKKEDLGAKNETYSIISTNENTQADYVKVDERRLENDMTSSNHYDMVCMNFDMDPWTNTNKEISTSISKSDTCSLSFEDSISVNPNSSNGESSLTEGDYWVEGVDSLLLWDCFSQQEDVFFLLGNN